MKTDWKLETDIDEAIIKIIGEIDFTVAAELREQLDEFVRNSAADVKVDLSELGYLDSSGLAALINLRKKLDAVGRAVTIVAVTQTVDRLLTLTQVKSLFGMNK